MSAEVTMSFVAAALTAVCSGPQLVRATVTTEGLSAWSWLQSYVLGAMWGTYGVATGAWVLAVSEGVFALGAALVVVRALALRAATVRLVGVTALVAVAYLALGPHTCLVVSSVASVTARGAQIVTTVRAGTAAAVSTSTWLVLAASNGAWSAAGALRGDVYFTCSAAAGGLASLAVVAVCRYVTRRPVGRRAPAARG